MHARAHTLVKLLNFIYLKHLEIIEYLRQNLILKSIKVNDLRKRDIKASKLSIIHLKNLKEKMLRYLMKLCSHVPWTYFIIVNMVH